MVAKASRTKVQKRDFDGIKVKQSTKEDLKWFGARIVAEILVETLLKHISLRP
jgi:hypothetical protein